MKVTPAANSLDKQIVTAMIVSTRYLREVRDLYAPEFLSADFARKIAGWCLEHYEKHEEAPGKHVQDIFEARVAEGKLKAEAQELIRSFLTSLSGEYDKHGGEAGLNVDFLMDETIRWFKRRDYEHLTHEIEAALKNAGPEEAEELIRQHHHIEAATIEGYDPLNDKDATADVFETPPDPLFYFDGAIGQLLNHSLVRENLTGIMAPEKSGKTFVITEIIKRACMNKCNVALFELGDMSSPQIKRRLYSGLCGMPSVQRYVGETTVPVIDCWWSQLGECQTGQHNSIAIRDEQDLTLPETPPDYKPCTRCSKCKECRPTVARIRKSWNHLMTRDDADRVRGKLANHMGNAALRFCVKPNNTFTAEMINDTLTQWKERQGFIPDVIGIDYDATMAREKGAKDEREGMNEQWKWFRRITQEWHCLGTVATQTDADGLNRENLNLSNFSGDKRKYSHVTGMLGIHGTREEFGLGLARLSWMLGREEELGMMDQVVMIRHLRICRPIVDSFWRDKTYKPKLLKSAIPEEEE